MKNPISRITITMMTISGLTACGGGGSDALHPNDVSAIEGDYIEAPFTLYLSSAKAPGSKKSNENHDLNRLALGGKEFRLPPADAAPLPANRYFVPMGEGVVSAHQMSYSRYGVVVDKDFNVPVVSLFAQGYPSAAHEIPPTAQYKGQAIFAYDSNKTENPGEKIVYLLGQSAFSLENKKLNGVISIPATDGKNITVKLSAAIYGNKFSGENDGTETHGGFYGPNGTEISGTYQNASADFFGSYGATKQ